MGSGICSKCGKGLWTEDHTYSETDCRKTLTHNATLCVVVNGCFECPFKRFRDGGIYVCIHHRTRDDKEVQLSEEALPHGIGRPKWCVLNKHNIVIARRP